MEAYKSKCLECNAVYKWSGYKTGIGKTKAQLLQMSHDDHTCRHCNSKTLRTGLDWGGQPGQPDISDYDQTILTDYEIKVSTEGELAKIDSTVYECRNCRGNYFTPVSKWRDTNGEFVLLYCMDCKIRTAAPLQQNNDDIITDDEMPPASAVNFAASLLKPPPSVGEEKRSPEVPKADPDADPLRITLYINEEPFFYNREEIDRIIERVFIAIGEHDDLSVSSLDEKGFNRENIHVKLIEIIKNLDIRPPRITPIKLNIIKSVISHSLTSEFLDIGTIDITRKPEHLHIRLVADVVKFKPGDIIRFTRRATEKFPSTPDIGQILVIQPTKDEIIEYGVMSSIHDGKINDGRIEDMMYYVNDSEIIELVERRSL